MAHHSMEACGCDDVEFDFDKCPMFTVAPYMFEPMDNSESNSSISSDEDAPPDVKNDRAGSTEWCLCGHCQPMPTHLESICCREVRELSSKITHEVKCITQLSGFQVNCLHLEVLELSFYEYLEYEGPLGDAKQIHE
nr:PREDICTED: uncharacterized protein LOC106705234 [Latimeria chalumnae]|eukprot:XP_014349537.1 PREDICTED: uncharacterized protein LOC106705234 [Latimeria chalumnae]